MENTEAFQKLLDLMERPAFYVRDGKIRCVSRSARARMVTESSPVAPMLGEGNADYQNFSGGSLTLGVTVGSVHYRADVERLDEGDLFLLSCDAEDQELRALALASQQLRLPLNQLLSAADGLFPRLAADAPEELRTQMAAMNRSLYQLLRLVLNMSDAHQSLSPRPELRDVSAVMQEIFDESARLCREAGVELVFENLPRSLYSLIDSSRLERAVYNLISNALIRVGPGGTIRASLTHHGTRLYLTVANPAPDRPDLASAGIFSRFLREPGLETSRSGLGLGLRLVQSAALAHGGTVLMEPVPDGGMRVTMSLAIRQTTDALQSPSLHIDYAGERNHALIELADSLPSRLYRPGQL